MKFGVIILAKGGTTISIRAAFMQRDADAWSFGHAEALAVPYARAQVERFSPRSKAILEIRSARDLAVLEKIYANSVLLGDQGSGGWGITYATEFHMTADSALFPPRPKWEERGYRPDEYSRWIKGDWRPIGELWVEMDVKAAAPLRRGKGDDAPFHNAPPYQSLPLPRADIPSGVILSRDMTVFIREEDIEWEVETVKAEDGEQIEVRHRAVALPLYQGKMVWYFDPSWTGWVSGSGSHSKWREMDWPQKDIDPQFLMLNRKVRSHTAKVVMRDVSSPFNQRTLVTSLVPDYPCGHKLPLLLATPAASTDALALAAASASLVCDFQVRTRFGGGGGSITQAMLNELAFPKREDPGHRCLARCTACLVGAPRSLSPARMSAVRDMLTKSAVTVQERLRLRCMLDAAVAALYELDLDDLKWILKDCDHPVAEVTNKAFARRLDPKGFWRVDKHEPPERRHTVLTLAAFVDLQAFIAGVTAAGGTRDDAIAVFCGQAKNPSPGVNGLIGSIDASEGWMLPENFRLADLGLGRDDRAQQPQPVASVLGPRFYNWQLSQDAAESWRECALHARNLLGAEGFERLRAELDGREPAGESAVSKQRERKPVKQVQEGLFG